MKNKKGWLRIVEAFLAVLIILTTVLIFINQQVDDPGPKEDIFEKQRQILEIISKNNTLRERVLIEDYDYMNSQVEKMIPSSWNFEIRICDINAICSYTQNYIETEVYSTEIVISSNLTQYNPKKVRFFVWFD